MARPETARYYLTPRFVDSALIIGSLAKTTKHPRFEEFRARSDQNARAEQRDLLNEPAEELSRFAKILETPTAVLDTTSNFGARWSPRVPVTIYDEFNGLRNHVNISKRAYDKPYWDASRRYSLLDVFNGSIQFFDDHTRPLPYSILPPEDDVRKYIDEVLHSPDRLTVSDQFEKLLNITDNNIVGAANLGFVTSRFMARASDFRAYPNIKIEPADLDSWDEKVAQFATADGATTSDGPGDTYYFWTYAFARSVSEACKAQAAKKVVIPLFDHGTELMIKFKNAFTDEPPSTPHFEATFLGRRVGRMLADHIRQTSQSTLSRYQVEPLFRRGLHSPDELT